MKYRVFQPGKACSYDQRCQLDTYDTTKTRQENPTKMTKMTKNTPKLIERYDTTILEQNKQQKDTKYL